MKITNDKYQNTNNIQSPITKSQTLNSAEYMSLKQVNSRISEPEFKIYLRFEF